MWNNFDVEEEGIGFKERIVVIEDEDGFLIDDVDETKKRWQYFFGSMLYVKETKEDMQKEKLENNKGYRKQEIEKYYK